jgi:hypothetical protein
LKSRMLVVATDREYRPVGKIENLSVDLIELKLGTQMRAQVDDDTVESYADLWKAKHEFPPLDVFYDGDKYILADGFHRLYGAQKAKRASVPCRIHKGDLREAILFACGANHEHGLHRSRADKRCAVEALLDDAEWSKRSARWIAGQCKVSDRFVLMLIQDRKPSALKPPETTDSGANVRTSVSGRDGKSYPATKPKKLPSQSEVPAPAAENKTAQSESIHKDKADTAAAKYSPENDEPEEDLSFDEQVKRANGQIESFCRQLTKFYEENCPKLQSIDYQGRFDSALAHVKAACGTLRTCKYHDQPCPKCSGEGCSACSKESDFGAVTVLTYKQLAG